MSEEGAKLPPSPQFFYPSSATLFGSPGAVSAEQAMGRIAPAGHSVRAPTWGPPERDDRDGVRPERGEGEGPAYTSR